jgi:DNA-binding XRE family transcriptional regulator
MNVDGEELNDGQVLVRLTAARRIARDGTGRMVRETIGASQAEIGRAVGVSKATISKWERGQREPTGEHAIRYWTIITTLALTDEVDVD